MNSPPLIDETAISPQPKTAPEKLALGTNCSWDFVIGAVSDLDREPEFVFRWRLIAQVDVSRELTQRLEEGVLLNDPDEPTDRLEPGPSLTIDYNLLFGKYGTQVDGMLGRSHRLELHITDADFVTGTDIDVEPGGGRDSMYWLVELDGGDC